MNDETKSMIFASQLVNMLIACLNTSKVNAQSQSFDLDEAHAILQS